MKTMFAALGLAVSAPSAWAQPPASPSSVQAPVQVDPEAMAEARTLLLEAGLMDQLDESMQQIGESTFTTLLREFEASQGERMPADLETRVRRIMREGITLIANDLRPTLLDDTARIYTRHFTASELRDLLQLLRYPVMQKMNRIAPQLLNESMQIGVAASARRMPELHERLRQEISAWEQDRRRREPRTS